MCKVLGPGTDMMTGAPPHRLALVGEDIRATDGQALGSLYMMSMKLAILPIV